MLRKIKSILIGLCLVLFSFALFTACQSDEVILKKITLDGYKTEFSYGEQFSVGDLVVTAEYSDGTTKRVIGYEVDSSKFKGTVAGTYTIYCAYTDGWVIVEADYTVSVADDTVVDLHVSRQKLYFDCGEAFSFGEGIVEKEYQAGHKAVTQEYTIDSSLFDANVVGMYEIKVIFGDVQTTYNVTVMDNSYVESIRVFGQRTQFSVGETFDFTGWVSAAYINERPEEIVSDYTVDFSSFDADVVGTYPIVVHLGEKNYTFDVSVVEMKSLKMLMIGNSFSEDTVQYIPKMAEALGYQTIEVGVLFIGGSTLQMHHNNSVSGDAAYDFQYYQDGVWIYKLDNEKKTLEFGIQYKDWDIITLQQNSVWAGVSNSYNILESLIPYVKEKATNPNVRLVWNMTWAYTQENVQTSNYGYADQTDMYESICHAVQTKIETNNSFVDISPSGTAIQNVRESGLGDTVNRDGLHLSWGLGRYIAGITMFCTLTGYNPEQITYVPNGLDSDEVALAKECVKNALIDKYHVTVCAYGE